MDAFNFYEIFINKPVWPSTDSAILDAFSIKKKVLSFLRPSSVSWLVKFAIKASLTLLRDI